MYVFFLATVMSRLFFRSFNRLLGDICYDLWMLVWLSSNSLLLGRRNGWHWINLFLIRFLVRQTIGPLTSWALGHVVPSWIFPTRHQCHQQLIGENEVGNICWKTSTLTPVNHLKSDSDRSFICYYHILQF